MVCLAADTDFKIKQIGDLLDHGKPQTKAKTAVFISCGFCAGGVFLIETLPDLCEVLRRDTDAIVFDREDAMLSVSTQRDPNVSVRLAVAIGVVDEVGDGTGEKIAVGPNGDIRRDLRGQADAVFGKELLFIAELGQKLAEVGLFEGRALGALIEAGEQQQLVDDAAHAHRLVAARPPWTPDILP